jgi:dihydrofolate synthase/folylpolyglutamate synthase
MARTLAEWLDWQQRQHPRAIDLGLERVRSVALRMGLLPPRMPVAIVGGTNGKGSTASTLAALLTAAGRRTGLFTSPHLVDYNERVQIDGRPVADAILCEAFEHIEACTADISLTFFEYNALAALDIFARGAAEAVVLEVGLGGRLDATNIVAADTAVLCSVGMDHMDWLGDSLEQIGGEKAGIFRSGQRVVLGTSALPATVFAGADALGCKLSLAERDFSWSVQPDGCWWFEQTGEIQLRLGHLPAPQLAGEIQYRNAATALAAWCALHAARPDDIPAPSHSAASAGLLRVRLPGRMQVLQRDAEWILDVAHNVPAAEVFAVELGRRAAARRTMAVFGMLGDKDVAGVTRALDALVDEWWLCPTGEGRGLDVAQLSLRMGATRGTRCGFTSVDEACALALRNTVAGERVLVCGSFHVVGPALRSLGL